MPSATPSVRLNVSEILSGAERPAVIRSAAFVSVAMMRSEILVSRDMGALSAVRRWRARSLATPPPRRCGRRHVGLAQARRLHWRHERRRGLRTPRFLPRLRTERVDAGIRLPG